MTSPSSRKGTGCAISFRKIERSWAGWARRRRKKGGSWKEGWIKNVKLRSSSGAWLNPVPAQLQITNFYGVNWYKLKWGFWVGHRPRAPWQNANQGVNLDSKHSHIWVFRCALWHYISNNKLPEQSLSLSSGSKHFSGQAAPCWYGLPLLPAPFLSCAEEDPSSSSLSLYPTAISPCWKSRSPLQRRCWGWTEEDPLIPKYTSTAFLVWCHTKGLEPEDGRSFVGPVFCWLFSQITWVRFSPFRLRLLGWRILCSGHEADSRHRESHLAKVQGEHITLLWPACWNICHEVFGALSGTGDLHRLCRLEVRRAGDESGRIGWCCSGVCSQEMPA